MEAATRSDAKPAREREQDHALVRLLTENAREMISRHAPDLTFLYASPAATRVLGYPPTRLVGQRLDDLVHPDDLAGLVSSFALAASSTEPITLTLRIRDADGAWRWCEASCRGSVHAPNGEPEIQAAIRDISGYKQIEKAIERVAREWRSTFDAARDAILMLDRQGCVIRVNQATVRLLDAPFSELLGQTLNRILEERFGLDDPFEIGQPPEPCRQVRRELQLKRQAGWLRGTIDPIINANGQPVGTIVFLSDISAEKLGEARLRETLDQVRQLSSHLQGVREDERKRIAREVHDELGHALTALKMEASWLARQLRSQPAQDLTDKAQDMGQLIDQTIATVRRISTELRPPVLDDLGLDAALEWLADDFQGRTGIRTRVHLPAEPAVVGTHQSSAAFRIAQEALTNIARHADANQINLHWRQHESHFCLEIIDDGCGFDRARIKGGFGLLGMTERARDLDGTLDVQSTPGQGTCIRLRFPRQTEP